MSWRGRSKSTGAQHEFAQDQTPESRWRSAPFAFDPVSVLSRSSVGDMTVPSRSCLPAARAWANRLWATSTYSRSGCSPHPIRCVYPAAISRRVPPTVDRRRAAGTLSARTGWGRQAPSRMNTPGPRDGTVSSCRRTEWAVVGADASQVLPRDAVCEQGGPWAGGNLAQRIHAPARHHLAAERHAIATSESVNPWSRYAARPATECRRCRESCTTAAVSGSSRGRIEWACHPAKQRLECGPLKPSVAAHRRAQGGAGRSEYKIRVPRRPQRGPAYRHKKSAASG